MTCKGKTMNETHICENCGQEHDGSYGSGRFCSKHCKQSWITKISNKSKKRMNQKFVCQRCGKSFVGSQQKRFIYCETCLATFYEERAQVRKEEGEKQRELNRKPGICENCGQKHDGSYKTGRFCSEHCEKSYAAKAVDGKKISHTLTTKTHVIHCIRCGKEITKQICVSKALCDECKASRTETGKIITECQVCGKPLSKRGRKTCCDECAQILRSRTQSRNLTGTGRVGGYREHSSRGKCGRYKGIYCASTYELAFLIYCLDHGIKIERNRKGYQYIFEGKSHWYYPDWLVNGDHLVETKNFITEQVLVKAAAVDDYPIEILDYEKLVPYFEYVAQAYGKRMFGRSNNFYELYDSTE